MKKALFFTGLLMALMFTTQAGAQTIAAPSSVDLFVQSAADTASTQDTTTLSLTYPLLNLSAGQLVTITDSVTVTFQFTIPDTVVTDSVHACIGINGTLAPFYMVDLPINPLQATYGDTQFLRSGNLVSIEVDALHYGEYFYQVSVSGSGNSSAPVSPNMINLINY